MKNKFLVAVLLLTGLIFTATSAAAFLGLGASPVWVALYKVGTEFVEQFGLITTNGEQIVTDDGDGITYDDSDRFPDQVINLEVIPATESLNVLWFEPSGNGFPIIDYAVEYKISSDTTYTLFDDGVSTDPAATIAPLAAGTPIDVKVTAISAIGYGPPSDVVTATPLGSIGGLDDVLSGVIAVWNGNNYSGTGDWLNEVSAPADGSAQSAYDLTPSGGSTYSSGCFTFDGLNNFDIGTNTAFLKNLHKTTAGNDHSWLALVNTSGSSTQMGLIGTADVTANSGVVWRTDTGGAHKFDQYNGVATVTQNGTNTVSLSQRYVLAVKFDYDSNTLGFARNSDTFITKSANWTANTTDATYSLKVGSEGNGGSKIAAWSICGLALIDHDISEVELTAANDWFDNEFPTAPAVAPGQVYSIITMPTNNGVHLAWDVLPVSATVDKTGGSAITDYIIETKPSASGTWTTVSDGASANTYYTWTAGANGTPQDFRLTAVNAVGAGVVSSVVSETPAAEGTNPFDESDWKITFPVDENTQLREGTNALEIEPPEIETYSNAWFGRVGNVFRYNCTYPAATTSSNAAYGRSELRGLFNGKEFAFDDDNEDEVEFRVTECPTSSGTTKTYVQQIHDDGPPLYKIGYDCRAGTGQDRLRLLMKTTDATTEDDVSVTLKSNITRGAWTNSTVLYDGDGSEHGGQQSVDFYIDGVLVHTQAINKAGGNGLLYNKRGNYCQLGPSGSKTTVEHRAPTF